MFLGGSEAQLHLRTLRAPSDIQPFEIPGDLSGLPDKRSQLLRFSPLRSRPIVRRCPSSPPPQRRRSAPCDRRARNAESPTNAPSSAHRSRAPSDRRASPSVLPTSAHRARAPRDRPEPAAALSR
jgi:hypothetical protein